MQVGEKGERLRAFARSDGGQSCVGVGEGAPVHGLYFIYKGKAKVAKSGLHGREQIVRFVHDGETIGEEALETLSAKIAEG